MDEAINEQKSDAKREKPFKEGLVKEQNMKEQVVKDETKEGEINKMETDQEKSKEINNNIKRTLSQTLQKEKTNLEIKKLPPQNITNIQVKDFIKNTNTTASTNNSKHKNIIP